MRAVVAAHLADLATFIVAVGIAGVPIGAESNPTMVAAYRIAGLIGVAAWKLLLLSGLVLLIRRVTTRSRRPVILIPYALGLAAVASNLTAIVRFH